MKLKIAIIKGVIPSYSEGFYDRLFSRVDVAVTVYCQAHIPGVNLKTIHNKYPENVRLLKFLSLDKEKFSFQFIPWWSIFSNYDVVFIQGNPRNLSHFLCSTLLRVAQKKIVLWTMGHSFRGNQVTESLRLYWSRIFSHLLLYTDAEVAYLKTRGFQSNYMLGQNNGLDQKRIDEASSEWTEEMLFNWLAKNELRDRNIILSCARLDPKNKFHQVLAALPGVIREIPDVLWCVIGTGSEESRLKEMATDLGIENHVRFVGELYLEDELAPWFLASQIFVHPAAIGLSLMHAFGYGLPVITHGNSDRQNPEFAAFETGQTGQIFEEDNIENLSDTIIKLLHDKEHRLHMKKYVKRIAREDYNVDVMVERFVKIAYHAAGITKYKA